jgi:pyruvate/2-oxoglutarate dehydrogenase complex dihydrolipoamide dehydrogenase (E3) component/uncharacterized membrane protein YdjX (TVP38/TMEM64 family)
MKARLARWAIAAILLAAIVVFFGGDFGRYLHLDYLKAHQAALDARVAAAPWTSAGEFFLVYVLVTSLSLPGAAVMTLLGGALFGLAWGTVLVSFASTAGAAIAFTWSRFLFRDAIRARYADRLRTVDAGVERDGVAYLLSLRLVPVFPYVLVNLMMGVTAIRLWTFWWVSQLGMLAGTLVFVNAGTELARITSLSGLLSPGVLGALLLLGVFPLLAARLVDWVRQRRLTARWPRPRRFDRNLIVIGAGSAGLVSAYIAAAVKAKVTLVEAGAMGGDCLNTGCVPSKALIRTARLLADAKRSKDLGISRVDVALNFAEVMDRVREVVARVAPHDSVERYTSLGVECVQGRARLVSPWEVEITAADGSVQKLTARSIVIATGARPFVPPIPGIEAVDCLTSDTVWGLRELPRRLVVLGGGPIGCELAQCFARLGSSVTQVEMADRLLVREDADVSVLVAQRLAGEGVRVLTGHKAIRFAFEAGERVLYCEAAGASSPVRIGFDAVLCAVGRRAHTEGLGLEALGIPLTASGTVEVDEFMRTRLSNVLACGDVAGPYQFTHTAAHTAWYAAVNGLFSGLRKFRADFSVIPWATFTQPEVARVGLNESEAVSKGVAFEVTRYGIDDLDRAIAEGAAEGFVKVITAAGTDRILGATIVGEHAGELITEFVTAMKNGIGLNRILGTIHIYPTWSEANKYAAGVWKKAHAPAGLLRWVERLHAWRRG